MANRRPAIRQLRPAGCRDAFRRRELLLRAGGGPGPRQMVGRGSAFPGDKEDHTRFVLGVSPQEDHSTSVVGSIFFSFLRRSPTRAPGVSGHSKPGDTAKYEVQSCPMAKRAQRPRSSRWSPYTELINADRGPGPYVHCRTSPPLANRRARKRLLLRSALSRLFNPGGTRAASWSC